MNDQVRDIAQGHWHSILPNFGINRVYLKNKHGPCPICQGTDRFRFDNKEGKGTFICNQCGSGDGFTLAKKATGKSFKEIAAMIRDIAGTLPPEVRIPQDRDEAACARRIANLWGRAKVVTPDDPVGKYLINRLGSLPKTKQIKFAEYRHPDTGTKLHPVMVARICDADGTGINNHLTYLDWDGNKAAVEPVKKVMAGSLPSGSAIQLGEVREEMGVAEGIETALAASKIHHMPVWSCLNGTMLSKWVLPESVKHLHIFGDNDANFTGQSKAYQLANRIKIAHPTVTVFVNLPKTIEGEWGDWADVLGGGALD